MSDPMVLSNCGRAPKAGIIQSCKTEMQCTELDLKLISDHEVLKTQESWRHTHIIGIRMEQNAMDLQHFLNARIVNC